MNEHEARKLLDPTHTIITDGSYEAELDLDRARIEAELLLEGRELTMWPARMQYRYGYCSNCHRVHDLSACYE